MLEILVSLPGFALVITLLAFCLGQVVQQRAGNHPLLNPVTFAMVVLISLLLLLEIPYEDYFQDAQFIHFLLGPATVALAVPLYRQLPLLKRLWLPILSSIVIAVSATALGAAYLGKALGMPEAMSQSMTMKSVTIPVAMGISDKIGMMTSMTILFVMITGNLGSIIGSGVLRRVGVTDPKVVGLALGATSHGQGAATAFQLHPEAGAFAGLAMALTAITASLLVPAFFALGWL
ncbi:LrgB family protein [Ferrimonas marina]|uniref:TIGR00659 family protein n=1 Tax=Ferrimonas marina TaxID=299255 RepID=A0A1M5VZ85_9GAMM|nr:LrgB family protein [Ferrimonas marina]SHH80233.1 TIGR00659 family protein [Ferrimonas marina]